MTGDTDCGTDFIHRYILFNIYPAWWCNVSWNWLLLPVVMCLLVGAVSAVTVNISTPVDGYIGTTANQTFAAHRAATTGTTLDTTAQTISVRMRGLTTNGYYDRFYKTILSFNTSNTTLIPSGAVISGVKLYLRRSGSTNALGDVNVGITGGALAANASIASGDVDGWASTELSNRVTCPASSSYMVFTFTSEGIAYVQNALGPGGYTVLFARSGWDLDNAGPWVSGADSECAMRSTEYVTDPNHQPKLEITYTLPDTTPPGTIQGLTNDTSSCEQITWDYQSPSDADFNHTMIYRDGVFQYNLSNTTYQDIWSGLTGGQTYEFASHTVDITGNVDPDWMNQSATAASCGAAPVANFTADNTSVCIGDSIWFNDTSEYTPAGAYDDYFEWDFGDGNTTAGFRTDGYNSPTYNYSFAGNKTVILTVTNKYGSDNETKVDYIEVIDCSLTADFTANQTCVIGVPADIQFTGSCDNLTYKNHWDFGTGDTNDDDQNPIYSYLNYGVYNVTHTCKISTNITLEETKTDYIIVGVNGTYCTAPAGNCTVGDYRPAYAFPSTEVVTIGFLGICGILVVGLVGRKE
jgi:PKD repeat protein